MVRCCRRLCFWFGERRNVGHGITFPGPREVVIGCESEDEGFMSALEDGREMDGFFAHATDMLGGKGVAGCRAVPEGDESVECGTAGLGQQPTHDEDVRVTALRTQFPEASYNELLRFVRARPASVKDAAKMYRDHLEWRRGQGSEQRLEAAVDAVGHEWVRRCGCALDGTPALHVQGACLDPNVGFENYMLSLIWNIDQVYPRDQEGKTTIFLDVRGAPGLPSIKAHKMMPFFKMTAACLPNQVPERVQRVIIYPMPSFVMSLWYVVRSALDSRTKEVFVILTASAGRGPPEKLWDYISFDQLPEGLHERHRAVS